MRQAAQSAIPRPGRNERPMGAMRGCVAVAFAFAAGTLCQAQQSGARFAAPSARPNPHMVATAKLGLPISSVTDDRAKPTDSVSTTTPISPRRLPAVRASSSDGVQQMLMRASMELDRQPRSTPIDPPVKAAVRATSMLSEPARSAPDRSAIASPYLPSATVTSMRAKAAAKLAIATSDYGSGAWASATATAWAAIRDACESIDVENSNTIGVTRSIESSALENLGRAQHAVRESEHFFGPYASDDPRVIRRLIHSHRTEILQSLTDDAIVRRSEAADRYLNHARRLLGQIAAQRIEAARALDLLAAIELAEDDDDSLRQAKSLCFRRAAFQGQPQNATLARELGRQLASVGLIQEADWALQQSQALVPSRETESLLAVVHGTAPNGSNHGATGASAVRSARSKRVPDVVTVSPQQFAAMSQAGPMSQHQATANRYPSSPQQQPLRMASRPTTRSQATMLPRPTLVEPEFSTGDPNRPSTASPVRRMLDSIGRMW